MADREIRFDRSQLYEEVWQAPMTHVAARYGLSDVAIRKICVKLAIPLPVTGHWAKKAAGKPPPTKPLPPTDGPTAHMHKPAHRYLDPQVQERTAQVLGRFPIASLDLEPVSLREAPEDCLPVVRRMAGLIRKAPRSERGWPRVHGPGIFELSVSPEMGPHALLVLDGVIRGAIAAGFELVAPRSGEQAAHLLLMDQQVTLRLSERAKRTERELTAQEKRQRSEGTLYWVRDQYLYATTGDLTLQALHVQDRFRGVCTTSRQASPLSVGLEHFVGRMVTYLAEVIARREVEAEREQYRRVQEERNYRARRIGEQCLSRLDEIETAAAFWNRAQILRGFSSAIKTAGDQKRSEADTGTLTTWIDRAADWLDPLADQPWPEVDEAFAAGLYDREGKWRRKKL